VGLAAAESSPRLGHQRGRVAVSRGRGGTREFDRNERVGAELLRELTLILRAGVKDPRLGDITLQEVRVSRDLSHAKVYFTCFPVDDCGPEQQSRQQRLLNGALAGYLRAQLARGMRLRIVPQLHFVHDDSVLAGERLAALIDSAVSDPQVDGEGDADVEAGIEREDDGRLDIEHGKAT
jgi:ribosome-binding factor A